MEIDNPITYVGIRSDRNWLRQPMIYFTLDMSDFRRALIQYVPKQRLGIYRDTHQLGVF